MPIHRRRFRIEEAFIGGDMPMPAVADGDVGPMHREIMNELRALRAQMASAGPARSAAARSTTVPGVNPMLNRICLKLRE
jgi:chemotaxis protein CheZ